MKRVGVRDQEREGKERGTDAERKRDGERARVQWRGKE